METGEGYLARLVGPQDEVREATFDDGKAEIPSLTAGRYALRMILLA